jgi:surfactin synthase thioesterase subunit
MSSRVQLYCLPYAGASASVYVRWKRRLPTWIEVTPVELPGRGRRMCEPLAQTLPALLDSIARDVRPEPGRPFAVFGHSLGAIIAFELAARLEQQGLAPAIVFASGTCPPAARDRERFAALQTDAELLAELRRLDGTPAHVLADAELMELALPVLRADFQIAANYTGNAERLLRAPLVALGGADDPTTSGEAIAAWRDQTRADFSMHMLPGGHFFIHEQESALFAVLEQHLRRAVTAPHVSEPPRPARFGVRADAHNEGP